MKSTYAPIDDFGLIGDCHSAALVSRVGSIDWCCLPRFDSGSCFGRLLDWERGGYCSVAPVPGSSSTRAYADGSLVLETVFRTWLGEMMPSGRYRAWRVETVNGEIAAGGGITILPWPPGPLPQEPPNRWGPLSTEGSAQTDPPS